jgi:hypothetical protein
MKRTVWKDFRTAGVEVTADLNTLFILKAQFPQSLCNISFTNPASSVGSAAIAHEYEYNEMK